MKSGDTDTRILALRADIARRVSHLATPAGRQALAAELGPKYQLHEAFLLGFIEDVLGVQRKPSRDQVARAQFKTVELPLGEL